MFSLCIPTMDRYDNFLSKYLTDYINNDLIDEIIITDENGNDVNKIKQHFNNDKLKLFINDNILGPFLNKLKACENAKNEWIALIDSDNFADTEYFIVAKEYINKNINQQKNIILAPSFAKPNFNYSNYSGVIYNKNNLKLYKNNLSVQCVNTGNYIINKFLINNINLTNETKNIPFSSACDVIYFNTLLFEQLDLNLHIVPNLTYLHVVHNNSIYLLTSGKYRDFNNTIYNRYFNI